MAKEVSKVIPVAERIIEFKERDFKNKSPLLIVDAWHKNIFQYDKEYPIVKYKCNESVCCDFAPDYRLNSFIETITVSTALAGKKISADTEAINVDYDTVMYYRDYWGTNHEITHNSIREFLIKKPNLVVSPEGMLIFFTDKEILATFDCNHCYFISGYFIKMEDNTIKGIEVCKDFCKVTLIDDEKTHEKSFSLKFDFDMTELQMICPKVSEL